MTALPVEWDEVDEVPFDEFIERHPFITDYTPAPDVHATTYPWWLLAIVGMLGVVVLRALLSAAPIVHF